MTSKDAKMYEVTTFMKVDIPIVRDVLTLFPITGETAVIYEKNRGTR